MFHSRLKRRYKSSPSMVDHLSQQLWRPPPSSCPSKGKTASTSPVQPHLSGINDPGPATRLTQAEVAQLNRQELLCLGIVSLTAAAVALRPQLLSAVPRCLHLLTCAPHLLLIRWLQPGDLVSMSLWGWGIKYYCMQQSIQMSHKRIQRKSIDKNLKCCLNLNQILRVERVIACKAGWVDGGV